MPVVSGYFGSASQIFLGGDYIDWINIANAENAPDGEYASSSLIYPSEALSQGLLVNSWLNNIPIDQTPTKIEVRIFSYMSSAAIDRSVNIYGYNNEKKSGTDFPYLVGTTIPSWSDWGDITDLFMGSLPTPLEINSGQVGCIIQFSTNAEFIQTLYVDSVEMRITYVVNPIYNLASNIKVEDWPAPDFLVPIIPKLSNRKKFASYQLPLSPLLKSRSTLRTYSQAKISITKNLQAKSITQTKNSTQEVISRKLSSNVTLQTESLRGQFYFANSPIHLSSSMIAETSAMGSLPLVNPVTVQQLAGSSLTRTFSYTKGFIEYVYLTAQSITQTFCTEAQKAKTVNLESQVFVQTKLQCEVSQPYLKKILLSSEVICNTVANKDSITIARPLNSKVTIVTYAIANKSLLYKLNSSAYTSTFVQNSTKSLLQNLSSQEIVNTYSFANKQIKLNLNSNAAVQTVSEYADYKIIRPLNSVVETNTYAIAQPSIAKKLSGAAALQTICEYADYNVTRPLNSKAILQTEAISLNQSVSRNFNSQVVCSSFNQAIHTKTLNLVSKVITETVSEYADYTVTRPLNSNSVLTSFSANVYSIKKNLSSEAISQTESLQATEKFTRPLASKVYTQTSTQAATTFNRNLESQAISETRSYTSLNILVGLTSRSILQTISEYADYKIIRPLNSEVFTNTDSAAASSFTKKLTSQSVVQSISENANETISRRYSSNSICSSNSYSSLQISRLYASQALTLTASQANIFKKVFVSSYTVEQSYSNGEYSVNNWLIQLHSTTITETESIFGSIRVARALSSNTIEFTSGYSKGLPQIIQFYGSGLAQTISEYADYSLLKHLASQTLIVSSSQAKENYLGTDNIVLDSLRYSNQSLQ